ncbi:hypothetical protein PYW08_001799 [Mythimna loreyi]|uniref:Uncharacterized protein n=1 Tax=Mythimna loreyi TaxID=667449 RepID=A0ACC2R5N1_9NEOP|nr:hypothetical protein PYW08_001799 [Mythimna loreyi]
MNSLLVNLCLVALHMSSNSAGASPLDYDGESLFDSSELSKYKMPESCRTQNFCFDEGEYPKNKIERILEHLPVLPYVETDDRIGSHFSDIESECPNDDSLIDKPIYYIRDENDQVRVVVQSKNFSQIYSVRQCKRPGPINYETRHFGANSTLLEKYKLECVNSYINAEFLVLGLGETVEIARPKGGLPMCCKCRYPPPN